MARSVRLFRAFRTEQAAPDAYYTVLARDTVRQLGQYADLDGLVVADVGGGPGYFAREFRAAGARAVCLDTDSGELAGLGGPGPDSAIGSALRLPLATGAVDVCFSSNVLEHVADWQAMLAEMVRVTRPGGVIFVTFTNWLSPWGGHETSPWHYLGGDRAARRYQRRHGRPPKNRYGTSLYPVSVAAALAWAQAAPGAVLADAVPRYLPGWTRPLLRIPVLREFLTWNLLLVLRRTTSRDGGFRVAPGAAGRPSRGHRCSCGLVVAQPDSEVLAAVGQRGRAGHHGAGCGAVGGLDLLAGLPRSQDRAVHAGIGGQVAVGEVPQLRVGRWRRHRSGGQYVQHGVVKDRADPFCPQPDGLGGVLGEVGGGEEGCGRAGRSRC